VKVITNFPRSIKLIEHTWITISDGTRLATRIWLPDDAEQNPVAAILEYLPYRKNDGTAIGDAVRHAYFAGHGYASVRVDIRGSGESDGLLYDEYLQQEQTDAVEVIGWIASQSWCTGRVGMMGISWGGFNSLQVAALRPASLAAIITLCSTDDRYTDDVHYIGGAVQAIDMLSWATTMLSFNARPPDPYYVGDSWRDLWLQRLAENPHLAETWLTHQRRDDYWAQGSVCEDYHAIACPVYVMGGWADGYTDSIFRLLDGLNVPKKALIGPWAHNWPHEASPGPAIGFLQECLRWWDHWLQGLDTGIMNEPVLHAWMQGWVQPASSYRERPGRWVVESEWPNREGHVEPMTWYLNDHGLAVKAADAGQRSVKTVLTHGRDAGVWCPFGAPGDLPVDQRAEDGRGLCFDSSPADGITEVLGIPQVKLMLSVDQPIAQMVVRICDVAEDGASLLLSKGILNLTHRDSDRSPQLLEPGTWYSVTVRMNAVAHALPAGHRWRLVVAPAYWPMGWPSPELVTISIRTGQESTLELDKRSSLPGDDFIGFPQPEGAERLPYEVLKRPSVTREVQQDLLSDMHTITHHSDLAHLRLANGMETSGESSDEYSIREGDPCSASVECQRSHIMERDDWRIRITARSKMHCSPDHFYVSSQLVAYEGDSKVSDRSWDVCIPRDLV